MSRASRIARVLRKGGLKGLRDRLIRANRYVWHRLRASASESGSYYGVRLSPNWQDATFRMYVKGSYGDFYARHLSTKDTPFCFLDIGANQGLYSLIAGRNPQCKAGIAFEPVPRTAALLRRNIALNDLSDKIDVIESAISDRAGHASIATTPGHSGAARIAATTTDTASITVDTVTRSDLSALTLPAEIPFVAKLDVEGHEAVVLRELLASDLGPRITEIFYECDENWVDPSENLRLLTSKGFSKRRKVGGARHYDILMDRPPTKPEARR